MAKILYIKYLLPLIMKTTARNTESYKQMPFLLCDEKYQICQICKKGFEKDRLIVQFLITLKRSKSNE